MARFKQLLRTTSSVEELLGLTDRAVRIALKYRGPHTWEWRELKATEGYRMDEVIQCNGALKTANWMSHVRFSGRLAGTLQTIVALIQCTGDEYWHAPYGEDSYDDYGHPLAPTALWLCSETTDRGKKLTRRFSVAKGGELYETT